MPEALSFFNGTLRTIVVILRSADVAIVLAIGGQLSNQNNGFGMWIQLKRNCSNLGTILVRGIERLLLPFIWSPPHDLSYLTILNWVVLPMGIDWCR